MYNHLLFDIFNANNWALASDLLRIDIKRPISISSCASLFTNISTSYNWALAR